MRSRLSRPGSHAGAPRTRDTAPGAAVFAFVAVIAAVFVAAALVAVVAAGAPAQARPLLGHADSNDTTPPQIRLAPFLWDGVVLGRGLGEQVLFTVTDAGGSGVDTGQTFAVAMVQGGTTPQMIPLTWTTGASGEAVASGTIPTQTDGTYMLGVSATDLAGNSADVELLYYVSGVTPPIAGLPPSGEIDMSTAPPSTSYTLAVSLKGSNGKPILNAKPRLYVYDVVSGKLLFRAPKRFTRSGKGKYVYRWFPARLTPDPAWGSEWRDLQVVVNLYDTKPPTRVASGRPARAAHSAAKPKKPSTTASHIKMRW